LVGTSGRISEHKICNGACPLGGGLSTSGADGRTFSAFHRSVDGNALPPPDLQFYALDRVALGVVTFIVILRTFVSHQSPWLPGPVILPLLGLALLALTSVLTEPYEAQNWSLFAAKWVVPLVLYQLGGLAFQGQKSCRMFETFSLVVLAYLSLTAVFFLIDARRLIFPRYILDESLGIHADRARGPFLQAVANGVTLNLLGVIALDSFRRKLLRGLLALLFSAALPVAILATKTRAVWASFAGSLLVIPFVSSTSRVKRACLCLLATIGICVTTFLVFGDTNTSLSDRLQERGPVEFRMGMYAAGLEMFLDKPIVGWNASRIQPELARRISDFHPPYFLFHNTYLEIAVKHGLLGLVLYVWVFVDLFRLGGRRRRFMPSSDGNFLDTEFRRLWPVLVIVYLVNASFVVMSYQFVNGLLFTIAGMLASQNRRASSNQIHLE
jgi:putative inorganic carbon (HCO3(-)) transporter